MSFVDAGMLARPAVRAFSPSQLNPLAWYDVHLATPGQTVADQMGGTAATLGSTAGSDANDPVRLSWTGTDYLYLPGVSGNYVSTPDSSALDLTGDIELVARYQPTTWSGAADQAIIAKRTASNWNYQLSQLAGTTPNKLHFAITTDGATAQSISSTANLPFTDGQIGWVKVTWVKSSGLTQFFTAADQATEPSSWTQLGTNQTLAAGATPFSGTAPLEIGSNRGGAGNALAGNVYRAIVRNGIAGTIVANFDPGNFAAGSSTTYTDAVGTNAGVWTINRTGSGRKSSLVKGRGLLLLGTDDLWTIPTAAIPSFGTSGTGTVTVIGRMWATPRSNGRWIDTRGSATETVAGVGIRQNGTAASLIGTIGDGTSSATTATVTYTAGGVVVASLVVDTTTIKLRINGTESATVARPAGSATGTTPIVGAATTAAASPFEGESFVVLTTSRVLTASEIDKVERYYGAGA